MKRSFDPAAPRHISLKSLTTYERKLLDLIADDASYGNASDERELASCMSNALNSSERVQRTLVLLAKVGLVEKVDPFLWEIR